MRVPEQGPRTEQAEPQPTPPPATTTSRPMPAGSRYGGRMGPETPTEIITVRVPSTTAPSSISPNVPTNVHVPYGQSPEAQAALQFRAEMFIAKQEMTQFKIFHGQMLFAESQARSRFERDLDVASQDYIVAWREGRPVYSPEIVGWRGEQRSIFDVALRGWKAESLLKMTDIDIPKFKEYVGKVWAYVQPYEASADQVSAYEAAEARAMHGATFGSLRTVTVLPPEELGVGYEHRGRMGAFYRTVLPPEELDVAYEHRGRMGAFYRDVLPMEELVPAYEHGGRMGAFYVPSRTVDMRSVAAWARTLTPKLSMREIAAAARYEPWTLYGMTESEYNLALSKAYTQQTLSIARTARYEPWQLYGVSQQNYERVLKFYHYLEWKSSYNPENVGFKVAGSRQSWLGSMIGPSVREALAHPSTPQSLSGMFPTPRGLVRSYLFPKGEPSFMDTSTFEHEALAEVARGFIGAFEAPVYSIGSMIGLRNLPVPPRTVLSLTGWAPVGFLKKALTPKTWVSTVERAGLAGQFSQKYGPTLDYSLMLERPSYAFGTIAGEIALSYLSGKALSMIADPFLDRYATYLLKKSPLELNKFERWALHNLNPNLAEGLVSPPRTAYAVSDVMGDIFEFHAPRQSLMFIEKVPQPFIERQFETFFFRGGTVPAVYKGLMATQREIEVATKPLPFEFEQYSFTKTPLGLGYSGTYSFERGSMGLLQLGKFYSTEALPAVPALAREIYGRYQASYLVPLATLFTPTYATYAYQILKTEASTKQETRQRIYATFPSLFSYATLSRVALPEEIFIAHYPYEPLGINAVTRLENSFARSIHTRFLQEYAYTPISRQYEHLMESPMFHAAPSYASWTGRVPSYAQFPITPRTVPRSPLKEGLGFVPALSFALGPVPAFKYAYRTLPRSAVKPFQIQKPSMFEYQLPKFSMERGITPSQARRQDQLLWKKDMFLRPHRIGRAGRYTWRERGWPVASAKQFRRLMFGD